MIDQAALQDYFAVRRGSGVTITRFKQARPAANNRRLWRAVGRFRDRSRRIDAGDPPASVHRLADPMRNPDRNSLFLPTFVGRPV